MPSARLFEAYLEAEGIRSTNFFNGRLLTGEDLQQEQAASRSALKRLGRAIGDGIAHGLEVTATTGGSSRENPVATVSRGLAMNREGHALSLANPVTLSLLDARARNGGEAVPPGGEFDACGGPSAGVYVAGTGVYLLAMGPARGAEGKAPVTGLGNSAAPCAARSLVEGVRFSLLALDLPAEILTAGNRLRNLVAYRCFGAPTSQEGLALNPFGGTPSWGAVEALRPDRLSDSEVPLALIYWTSSEGIRWVDSWPVRRPVLSPSAGGAWPRFTGDRVEVEAGARLLQFQAQLESLRSQSPATLRVADHFRFLPPAGLIPIRFGGGAAEFNGETFFTGITTRKPMFMEGARLESMLRQSYQYPPIDLQRPEMVWIYRLRENAAASAVTATPPRPTEAIAFAHAAMPYQGEPRLNVSHWDFANYVWP